MIDLAKLSPLPPMPPFARPQTLKFWDVKREPGEQYISIREYRSPQWEANYGDREFFRWGFQMNEAGFTRELERRR